MEIERAILVGAYIAKKEIPNIEESLDELAALAYTAGAKVVHRITQVKDRPDLRYYIGTGKLEELRETVASSHANLVIFDCELSESQVRNLEAALGLKVIDRTELILDIFAQHAHSREGALQVELAQANYTLTHLTGKGILMSRLGGGIGTRGPGETKLEMDRRIIRKKISILKKELESIRKEREIKRKERKSKLLPVAAIVGYTNSGKSTLLNALTSANTLVDDRLFSTLDPKVKRLILPNGREMLITDTVGFIQNLPHQLIEAFKATLEEVSDTDLLLHVVDSSHSNLENQIVAVYRVLEELNAITKPIITIFNKIDKLHEKKIPKNLEKQMKPSVAISALYKKGLDDLLWLIVNELRKKMKALKFKIPIREMNMVHLIHEKGEIMEEKYLEDSVLIKAKVDEITKNRFKKFIL